MGRDSVTKMLIGAAVLALAVVVVGLVYMYSGAYNIAATDPHTGPVRWVLQTTQEQSIAAHAGDVPEPPALDSSAVAHGFEHFHAMCVDCHGAPGVERGEYGQGLNPEPPELSEEAAEWSAAELFWIVKHGIKMAGMPAFGPTHTDEEIWGIVRFVERLPQISPEEYQRLAAELEARGGGHGHGTGAGTDSQESGQQGGHSHAPGTPAHEH